jgi:hypothetical protein
MVCLSSFQVESPPMPRAQHLAGLQTSLGQGALPMGTHIVHNRQAPRIIGNAQGAALDNKLLQATDCRQLHFRTQHVLSQRLLHFSCQPYPKISKGSCRGRRPQHIGETAVSNKLARATPRRRSSRSRKSAFAPSPTRSGFRPGPQAASAAKPHGPSPKLQWLVGAAALLVLAVLITIASTLWILSRHHRGH